MESSSLMKWRILEHMTDEELSNIAHLQVYGGRGRSNDAGLSVLYVTHDDGVFGTGFNSMIGDDTTLQPFDEKESQEKSVKVEALSGLGITKIVVGKTFGAALSSKGEVYSWGYFGRTELLNVKVENIVIFESYVGSNKLCKFCSPGGYSSSSYYYGKESIGSISINRCTQYCTQYPTYTTTSPPPSGTAVRSFLKFSKSVPCLTCMAPTTSKPLNGHNFHFCAKCNKMLEVSGDTIEVPHFKGIQKLQISEFWKIRNIDCGSTFFIIETSSNRLLLLGTIDNFEYHGFVSNPDEVRFKSLSCGASHIAVISSRGELYTCGLGDKGQLGYEWTADMGHMTLRKVPLNGSVVKVCCGYSSTACLMSNGSIVCFGSNMKKLSSGIISLSNSEADFIDAPTNIMESVRFVDLTHSPLTNIFCAKTEDFLVCVWGKSGSTIPEVQLEVSELAVALADLPYTYASQAEDTLEQLSLHSVSMENGLFFGNKSFSDLTLKLADGDFPVHCLVLLSNSSYFKGVLSDKDKSLDVLDMSSYNPTAYKCLLKYFYRLPLDDLNCEDLFDLHSIACSYKEKELVDSTFKKLKTMINQDTVLKLHAKATSTNAEDILRECELFLSSPEFKNDLISFVSQDMKNAIAILKMKSGE